MSLDLSVNELKPKSIRSNLTGAFNKMNLENNKFFYISHINDKNKEAYQLKVDISAINKSKVLKKIYDDCKSTNTIITPNIFINEGDSESLIFVVKYLNTYKDIEEIAPPEKPLLDNVEITEIFEDELHIFADLLNIQKATSNIKLAANIAKIADELLLENLYKKVCAIISMYIQTIE